MQKQFSTIIFDLGGVLIDWNPRYVFKQIFTTDEAVEHFLSSVCTNHWNEQQDGGRSFAEATEVLIAEFPHYSSEIAAYYGRWKEMLGGPIDATVNILRGLKDSQNFKLLALTNWSAESFPVALERYDFLSWFDGILVSGVEKMKKPDPQIYQLLLERYNVQPSEAIFIDDNIHNVHAARSLGIDALHFTGSEKCRSDLKQIISW